MVTLTRPKPKLKPKPLPSYTYTRDPEWLAELMIYSLQQEELPWFLRALRRLFCVAVIFYIIIFLPIVLLFILSF